MAVKDTGFDQIGHVHNYLQNIITIVFLIHRLADKIQCKEQDMAFWNLGILQLEEFRPGIMSKAKIGDNLIMVCMQIAQGKEDTGHEHSFDQCGIVIEGQIEML